MKIDDQLFFLINHLPHNWVLNKIAFFLHVITKEGAIYYPIAITLYLSQKDKLKSLAYVGTCSALLTFIVNDGILKNIFVRARPYEVLMNTMYFAPAPDSYSFPSGQTAVAFAVASVIWLYFPKTIWSYGAGLFALLIAVDRIYLGHHYPSDVLAGALVGIGIAYLTNWLLTRRSRLKTA